MMTKTPGKPNFGKPNIGRQPSIQTSFEEIVKELKLSPGDYASSAALKEWVLRNKDLKYVPPDLLKIWGFEVRGE